MDDLTTLFDISDMLRRLDSGLEELDRGILGGVAGPGPAAAENRAVDGARAHLTRQRARALHSEVAAARRRTEDMVRATVELHERAAASATRRAMEPPPRVPLGVTVSPGPHHDEPHELVDALRGVSAPGGFDAPESALAAGRGAWLADVLEGARVELGAYDREVAGRVAELGPAAVQAVAGWVARSRAAARPVSSR